MKIISGAQTGVDQAALDAAIQLGIVSGGWCPEGRLNEEGVIPAIYPVRELPNAGYSERTLQNVRDSDGTLIFYFAYLSGGTEQTVEFCIKEKKPYLLIDATELSEERAVERIEAFVRKFSIFTLNVAGPRASGEARAYSYSRNVMDRFLSKSKKG